MPLSLHTKRRRCAALAAGLGELYSLGHCRSVENTIQPKYFNTRVSIIMQNNVRRYPDFWSLLGT